MIELLIQWGDKVYEPSVLDDVCWETERKGTPGKLTFSIYQDDNLYFEEGASVSFKVDGNKVFYGFVFIKKRGKEKTWDVTAYDQLRYLKNKDTYVYTNKRADQLIQMIAADFSLNVGHLENTMHTIGSRVEDNQTLFDIIQNALDETLMYRNEMFILFDDFGKLRLEWIENMKLGVLIDEETGEDFSYTTSIDGETYNRIKLVRENDVTGKRDVFIAQHGENINKWGILQYFDTIDENINGAAKAEALLKLYNKKTKNLTVSGVLGDIRVRGGTMLVVQMDLSDVKLQNFMLVEKVKHIFKNNEHRMDLTLRGNGFN